MIVIHHVPRTRGFRVVWLCEELGLDYRIAPVDFSAEFRATSQWRRMNPVGKVPVVELESGTLFESGAIVQHILDAHGEGRLQPTSGTPEHAQYLQWSWFAEATFGRATGELANHKRAFAGAHLEAVMDEMRARARLALEAVARHLDNREYLLGSPFTAADIMMGYTLASFVRHVGDPFPSSVQTYWDRLEARPAYQAAIAAEAAA